MNAKAWVENFTEDGVIYDPVGKPPSNVHSDYQKFFGLLSMIFAKLELTLNNIFIVDNGCDRDLNAALNLAMVVSSTVTACGLDNADVARMKQE